MPRRPTPTYPETPTPQPLIVTPRNLPGTPPRAPHTLAPYTATSDLAESPVALGEGGTYSEILRMLLDAGASPFMQRIPPLWDHDGGMLDQEISGNV